MRYPNRIEAGKLLAASLQQYQGEEVVVLAVPRGGLPVAAPVAQSLKAPLDVALSKKIGHPLSPEYAIGAVSLNDVVLTDARGISETYIERQTQRIRDILKQRYRTYHKERAPVPLKSKVVILVDDGVATGNTLMVLTQLIRKQQPKKIVIAVPVASPSALEKLKSQDHIDEVICLQSPPDFQAVGQYYLHFYQVSDAEAIQILEENTQDV